MENTTQTANCTREFRMKKIDRFQLSIIIPAYNEATRLPRFLDDLFLEFSQNLKNPTAVEIILVDDGSMPENYALLCRAIENIPIPQNIHFQFLRYERNRGKGGAIAYGIANAHSIMYLSFVDADGATPAYEVRRAWEQVQFDNSIDYLAGSRIVMFGRKVSKTFKRHLTNRIFSTYFTLIFGIKMYDPQCGMKFFRKSCYESVQDYITDFRWLWDTQLTVLIYRFAQYKMIEFPIDWTDIPGSKISIWKDSLKMLFLLWKYRNIGKDVSVKSSERTTGADLAT